ncbi:MAG TPA: hypothetical protein VKH61_19785, partial [Streptosporangiaceae bacterium]|nr:hypothetical protein [Streptosporangiaceae bacterium]
MESLDRRTILRYAGTAAGVAALGTVDWWVSGVAQAATTSGKARAGGARAGTALDTVVFGDSASEAAHAIVVASSAVIAGQLGQPARVLNSLGTTLDTGYWGGSVTVTLAVDPVAANYVTVKFWGGDYDTTGGNDSWRIQIFLDGEVMGWFDQAVVDNADLMDV